MRCDCCGEDWEKDFFCEICSREGELVEVTMPIVMWDYFGLDIDTVEEWTSRDICLNCCPGHPRSSDAA
jgi:hypothetical protein